MKRYILATILLLMHPCFATSLGIVIVKQPIYLHGGEADVEIQIRDIPYVTASDTNEARFAAICSSFIPPSGSTWKQPHDINIASLYGISVSLDEQRGPKGVTAKIVIDARHACRPEGYPFTIDQVIDSVTTCVKCMSPQRPEDEYHLIIEVLHPPGPNDKKP